MSVDNRCARLFYEWLYEHYPEYRRDRSSYARPEVRRMWEVFRAGYESRQFYGAVVEWQTRKA